MTDRRVDDPQDVIVIFKTHLRREADLEAYGRVSRRMHELVEAVDGFVSIKTFRAADGEEIDLVRFKSMAALEAWRTDDEHREAQRRGREELYDRYSVQVCRVVRDYEFLLERPAGAPG